MMKGAIVSHIIVYIVGYIMAAFSLGFFFTLGQLFARYILQQNGNEDDDNEDDEDEDE